MADTQGQADIRGIDIDKVAKGFADEPLVMKRHTRIVKTSAREIRWYKKTAGYLDTADTTALTGSRIKNRDELARPHVVVQSWTRTTSYVRKYIAETETISMEDIADNDVDIWNTHIRDVMIAVQNQVDERIYNVTADDSGDTRVPGADAAASSNTATADGWDDTATGDPITDIMTAKKNIRDQRYDPEGAMMAIDPVDHKNLLVYLINVKGSSIPNFSSERIKDGVVVEVLGLNIIVSKNFVTDYAVVFIPNLAAEWRAFTPLSSAVIDDPGIGKKIRVWEEGEALLVHPKAVNIIKDLQV